jgi:hypothetical protein
MLIINLPKTKQRCAKLRSAASVELLRGRSEFVQQERSYLRGVFSPAAGEALQRVAARSRSAEQAAEAQPRQEAYDQTCRCCEVDSAG